MFITVERLQVVSIVISCQKLSMNHMNTTIHKKRIWIEYSKGKFMKFILNLISQEKFGKSWCFNEKTLTWSSGTLFVFCSSLILATRKNKNFWVENSLSYSEKMSFKSHFRCSNLKLNHEEARDFYTSTVSYDFQIFKFC